MNKATFIKRALTLASGQTLPERQLQGEEFDAIRSERLLTCLTNGSRRSWKAKDEESLRKFIADKFGIKDLEKALETVCSQEIKRADLVQATGDSKFLRQRTFKGFLVNCYQRIEARLNGQSFILEPVDGVFSFIYDYEHFAIPENVIVVGIENPENFRYLTNQRSFFEDNLPKGPHLLFVSRYPQNQYTDLIKWLSSIPNQYIHFGDLDLAAINIFLTEFYRHLGKRSSFLIPKDYETRIQQGSTERYIDQYERFNNLQITDERLLALADCIKKNRRGYDQEGFILS